MTCHVYRFPDRRLVSNPPNGGFPREGDEQSSSLIYNKAGRGVECIDGSWGLF